MSGIGIGADVYIILLGRYRWVGLGLQVHALGFKLRPYLALMI